MGAFVELHGGRYDTDVVINGRPDFHDHQFGITYAKRFPPYVFSRTPNSCLVHKIAVVELWWWRVATARKLVRQSRPQMFARTVCGQTKFMTNRGKKVSEVCDVPAPDAVLCGRCHGELATFSKNGAGTKAGLTRQAARAKLGCMVEGWGV